MSGGAPIGAARRMPYVPLSDDSDDSPNDDDDDENDDDESDNPDEGESTDYRSSVLNTMRSLNPDDFDFSGPPGEQNFAIAVNALAQFSEEQMLAMQDEDEDEEAMPGARALQYDKLTHHTVIATHYRRTAHLHVARTHGVQITVVHVEAG